MATQILTMANGIASNGKLPAKVKTKNQYKRLKAKQKKATTDGSRASSVVSEITARFRRLCHGLDSLSLSLSQATNGYESAVSEVGGETDDEGGEPNVEYVTEALDVEPGLEAFSNVFARFQLQSEGDAVSRSPPNPLVFLTWARSISPPRHL